jgi:alpha-acetolactate decarboxylase
MVRGQSVVRNGNTFTQTSKKKAKEAFMTTPYTYVAADGTKYPIYISGNGKYFIIRKSKKTGKEYRQYLPEIQKQLSK